MYNDECNRCVEKNEERIQVTLTDKELDTTDYLSLTLDQIAFLKYLWNENYLVDSVSYEIHDPAIEWKRI